jgi:hypothetical protein
MKEDTTHLDPTWMEKTGGYANDMTLRDYYAGLAMQAILSARYPVTKEFDAEHQVAKAAYISADAMLEERNR